MAQLIRCDICKEECDDALFGNRLELKNGDETKTLSLDLCNKHFDELYDSLQERTVFSK